MASRRHRCKSLKTQKRSLSLPLCFLSSLLPCSPNILIFIVDESLQLVNQRDEEITRIAKSIEELAQIFKELAVLVIDQGTILDRIDYNMEQVIEHTKEGIVQLEKAENYQKSALPMRCIILLVVLIGIMLGVLVLKVSLSKKK